MNFCWRRNRHEGDNLNGNVPTNNINYDNLNNNEVDEINNATNSCLNNQNENQEYFNWNDVAGTQFASQLNNTYQKIVHWKRNLFTLPSGVAGKNYIEEVTRLMKLWINDMSRGKIALKAVRIMPSKSSKSKDHRAALERRLKLWEEGKIEELLCKGQTIQERLKSSNSSMTIAKISMKFRILMSKGNMNGALKWLMKDMSNGNLPLTDGTLQLLKQKHPESREPPSEVLIEGPIRKIHPIL